MKKGGRKKKTVKPPSVRLPLPRRGEKRHGDVTKYHRAKEKFRVRKELQD